MLPAEPRKEAEERRRSPDRITNLVKSWFEPYIPEAMSHGIGQWKRRRWTLNPGRDVIHNWPIVQRQILPSSCEQCNDLYEARNPMSMVRIDLQPTRQLRLLSIFMGQCSRGHREWTAMSGRAAESTWDAIHHIPEAFQASCHAAEFLRTMHFDSVTFVEQARFSVPESEVSPLSDSIIYCAPCPIFHAKSASLWMLPANDFPSPDDGPCMSPNTIGLKLWWNATQKKSLCEAAFGKCGRHGYFLIHSPIAPCPFTTV